MIGAMEITLCARMTAMLTPRLTSRFLHDRRGSIVPMFALAIVPIIGFVGAAVDYSRANSVKAAMQSALDATGLMLSKEASTLTGTQMTQKANDYFKALFDRPETKSLALVPTLKALPNGGYQLDIAGSGWVDTTFTRVIGQTKMKVNATTQIVWGFKKLELALALDNTGSMSSSSKMTNLKAASHSLVKILKKASQNPGDIKISIIPFDTTVNIGTSYKKKIGSTGTRSTVTEAARARVAPAANILRIIGAAASWIAPSRSTSRTRSRRTRSRDALPRQQRLRLACRGHASHRRLDRARQAHR